MEVAEQQPHAFVAGLDISTEQFPPKQLRPKNCALDVLDLTKEIPEKHRGRFDVVHALLRFGSYLQWDDVAYPVMLKVKSVSNGLEGVVDVEREHWLSPALAEVGSLRVKTEWYEEFTTACGKAGSFRDIEKLRLSINPRVLGIEAKTTTMGVQRMIERILSGGMTKEERLIDGIRSEAEGLNALAAHGTFVTYNWFIRVARKA